ncbi:hypothetical protein D3C86_1354330 [compost metagenome]
MQIGGLFHGAGQLVEGADYPGADDPEGQQQPQPEDTGENKCRSEDVLLDPGKEGIEGVVKAHRPQHRILRHLVTAGAVGAAKIRLGQQGAGHHQLAVGAVVHHLQAPLARQGQGIESVLGGLGLATRPVLLVDRRPAHYAGIFHVGVIEELGAQGVASLHLAGQHQHVEAVEIGLGLLAALFLDEGQDEVALAHRLIGRGKHQYHGEDEEQEEIDLGSDGEAHGKGTSVG